MSNVNFMLTVIIFQQTARIALDEGIDITLPVSPEIGSRAFGVSPPVWTPLLSVDGGNSCNCFRLTLSPHTDGTHIEGVGHINKEHTSLLGQPPLPEFIPAYLMTVTPHEREGDSVITFDLIDHLPSSPAIVPECVIIRTNPNNDGKRVRDYNGKNPPYFTADALEYFAGVGVKVLIVDIPSVDRENSNGQTPAHHAFFHNALGHERFDARIIELVYIPNDVQDGWYLASVRAPQIDTDAVPCSVIIYPLTFGFKES